MPASLEIEGEIIADSAGNRYRIHGNGESIVLTVPNRRALLHLWRTARRAPRLAQLVQRTPIPIDVLHRGRTLGRIRRTGVRVRPFAVLWSIIRG